MGGEHGRRRLVSVKMRNSAQLWSYDVVSVCPRIAAYIFQQGQATAKQLHCNQELARTLWLAGKSGKYITVCIV